MIVAVTSTDVLVSINSALVLSIVFLAIQLSKLAQRVSRIEGRLNGKHRMGEDE